MALSKQDGEQLFYGGYNPVGYQQITDLTTVASLTVPEGAHFALINCETANVRWRDDGTNPTGSVGMPLTKDTYFFYTGDLSALRFLQVTAGAILNVVYY